MTDILIRKLILDHTTSSDTSLVLSLVLFMNLQSDVRQTHISCSPLSRTIILQCWSQGINCQEYQLNFVTKIQAKNTNLITALIHLTKHCWQPRGLAEEIVSRLIKTILRRNNTPGRTLGTPQWAATRASLLQNLIVNNPWVIRCLMVIKWCASYMVTIGYTSLRRCRWKCIINIVLLLPADNVQVPGIKQESEDV